MAIWQYQLFFVPEEEISSLFSKAELIKVEDFDMINWWKYRQLNISQFGVFESILARKKSWSDSIILFGDESSNCICLLEEDKKIVEISTMIDLRGDFELYLVQLCDFASKNSCMFLNGDLKILYPNYNTIKADINTYDKYKSFLDKLKKW